MTITQLLVPTYTQMLTGLAGWLRKAGDESANADALMSARLAPDMFPLATQVRFACVQAFEGVYRLQHETFPPDVDILLNEGRNAGEQPGTMADALARIDETLAMLKTVAPDAMNSGAPLPLSIELPMGIAFDLEDGAQYARDWSLPQFYFHIMTAYAILRNQGIGLGKADYVAHMFAFLRPGTAPAG